MNDFTRNKDIGAPGNGGQFASPGNSSPEASLPVGDDLDAVTTQVIDRLPAGHRLKNDPQRVRAIVDNIAPEMTLHLPGDLTNAVERAITVADRENIQVYIPEDDNWPAGFSRLGEKAPKALWAKGNTALLDRLHDGYAFDGSRAATGYGEHVAMTMVADLSEESPIITSGQYGIAAMAARAGTASHPSNVVIFSANGIDRPYPAGNEALHKRVESEGLVISEVAPGFAPTRARFQRRAELMAASSKAFVLVEASHGSSSLGAARRASELGVAVGAVPGPVTSAASEGANSLIRSGVAVLVATADDVRELHND